MKREVSGKIVTAVALSDNDEILVLTNKGKMMRCNLDTLKNKSKVTQANNIVSLDDGDTVQTVSVVPLSNKDFEEDFTE